MLLQFSTRFVTCGGISVSFIEEGFFWIDMKWSTWEIYYTDLFESTLCVSNLDYWVIFTGKFIAVLMQNPSVSLWISNMSWMSGGSMQKQVFLWCFQGSGCSRNISGFYLSNSSPPVVTYMCQWIGSALVQIMACRLFGAKPLSKPMLGYCQLDPQENFSNFNQNTTLFIHENASENIVCEMAAILSRGRWVNMI